MLKISGLTHQFGGLTAISNFSEELGEPGIYGLIGPNGAGKTTVFNLVSGFYLPQQGGIEFSGNNLIGLRPHQITHLGIARTFQNLRLWQEMTVVDNLALGQHQHLGYSLLQALLGTKHFKESEQRVKEQTQKLAEIFQLGNYLHETPKQLPYGIQRKVEIARALATNPKLLLLDEPAAGLNGKDTEMLMELITFVQQQFQVTIWMVEHKMRLIMKLCRRIKVLDFGRVIANGTAEEIRQHPEVIRAYLGTETI
jgi:branched-chain amino acid transport system ATP-binding protein